MEPGSPGELTELQRRILEFERRTWRQPGAKLSAIRETFEFTSATAYFARLNQMLDDPAAMRHDPELVGRLRRLRDERTRHRAGGVGLGRQ